MSEVYRDMEPAFMMRAEIWRRTSFGSNWRETRRTYRLIQSGQQVRVDLMGDDGDSAITRIQRDGLLILYTSVSRKFSEQPETDPTSAPVRDAIRRLQTTLYSRFRDLTAANHEVISASSAQLKVAGKPKSCVRVKIRSASGDSRKWSGEVWIEVASALVWRAKLTTRDGFEQLVEEEAVWQEISRGSAAPLEELKWQPPAGVVRVPRFPYTLPQ